MRNKTLLGRLSPLYVSSFFQGLIFWYAIEKVFMVHIGFTTTLIAVEVIVMNVVGLLLNIPSGIIADRWSRKGIIILAVSALGLSSLAMGLSHTVLEYIGFSTLFGVYFALHDGVFDSMIYDTLLEENNSREGYEKHIGYYHLSSSSALIVGSIGGALIAQRWGLSSAYLVSIPSSLIAIAALFVFREPKLHRQQENSQLTVHVMQTIRTIFRPGYILWILLALLASATLFDFMLEVDQLWPLALHLKLGWYGPLNALLLAGYGLGGPLASLVRTSRKLILCTCLLGVAVTLLLYLRRMPIIAVAQFSVICLFIALYTIALGKLHDTLPSHLRSSSSSMANMLASLVFIPLVLIFGSVAQRHSVFVAAHILTPIALVSAISFFVIQRLPNSSTL